MNTFKIKIIEPTPIPNSYKEEINTSIHAIDKEKANAEIEKGEIVFSPETLILQKASGKKHSSGGTPVKLDEGSFVFSDFKKLGLNKKDIERMEFKKGGSYKPANNTPSKILNREIDIKHHNNMINILRHDKDHDDITKTSVNLMLKKNMEKIGQVGYIQEEKKEFPEGHPEFSKGTAPVYSNMTDDDIDKSEQFKPMKYDPYLDKFKMGGLKKMYTGGLEYEYSCPCGRGLNGQCLPCPDGSPLANPYIKAAPLFNTVPPKYNQIANNDGTKLVSYSNRGPLASAPDWRRIYANLSPKRKAEVDAEAKANKAAGGRDRFGKLVPANDFVLHRNDQVMPLLSSRGIPTPIPETIAPLKMGPIGEAVGEIKSEVRPTTYHVGVPLWEKINATLPFLQAAKVKTYLPLRQHQESVIPQLQNIDDQPLLNNINQSYFNAANQNRLQTNSGSAIAGNEQLSGNRLDSLNSAVANILSQNVQVQNNQRIKAAESLNTDAVANRALDRSFYDQTITALQNRDDLKDFKNNQGLTNVNAAIEKNQAFNSQLNSQQQYQTDEQIGTNADGMPIFRSRALYEAQPNLFGYDTAYTPNFNINFKNLPGAASSGDSDIDNAISNLIKTGNYKDAAALMSSVAKYRYRPQSRQRDREA